MGVRHGVSENMRSMAILRRTESNGESNVWFKTDGEKRTEDLMEMLGLKETVVQMAKAN